MFCFLVGLGPTGFAYAFFVFASIECFVFIQARMSPRFKHMRYVPKSHKPAFISVQRERAGCFLMSCYCKARYTRCNFYMQFLCVSYTTVQTMKRLYATSHYLLLFPAKIMHICIKPLSTWCLLSRTKLLSHCV